MRVILEVPEYNIKSGFKYKWETNFTVRVTVENKVTTLSANKEGLISLANHLLNLAQDAIKPGTHIHLDESNSLEEGSIELIIEKV